MKKVFNKQQLKEISMYSEEVIKSIKETIEVLDDNYGVNRSVEEDLGGYVLLIENLNDVKVVKEKIIRELLSECIDIINVASGEDYISMLFLLSVDYAIVIYSPIRYRKYFE